MTQDEININLIETTGIASETETKRISGTDFDHELSLKVDKAIIHRETAGFIFRPFWRLVKRWLERFIPT